MGYPDMVNAFTKFYRYTNPLTYRPPTPKEDAESAETTKPKPVDDKPPKPQVHQGDEPGINPTNGGNEGGDTDHMDGDTSDESGNGISEYIPAIIAIAVVVLILVAIAVYYCSRNKASTPVQYQANQPGYPNPDQNGMQYYGKPDPYLNHAAGAWPGH